MKNALKVTLASPYEINKNSLILLEDREVGYIKFDQAVQRYRLTDGISCLVDFFDTFDLALAAAEEYFLKKKYITVDLNDSFYPLPRAHQIAIIYFGGREVGHVVCHSGKNFKSDNVASINNSLNALTYSFWAINKNSTRRHCCTESNYDHLKMMVYQFNVVDNTASVNFPVASKTGIFEINTKGIQEYKIKY